MDFALTEEQRLLQSTVNGVLDSECSLDLVRKSVSENNTRLASLSDRLAEIGIPGLLVPQEYGGVGLVVLDAALVAESLGAVVAPYSFTATSVMAPVALLYGGSEEQRNEWLPRIANGESTFGIAVADFTGKRDSQGVTDQNGKLNGQTMFAIDANDASMFIVADASANLHIVDAADVQVNSLNTIDRTRSFGELVFSNIPSESLVSANNQAEALRMLITAGRIMIAADTLGAAQTMLNKAVVYAGECKQFNRTIGSFQAVKHMCAEMAAELEPCRSLVWYAAHCFNAIPQELELNAYHAKAHLAEVGRFVARKSTEVHGGMGFTDLLGLLYWFKRIELNRQILGTPEFIRNEAAKLQGWAS